MIRSIQKLMSLEGRTAVVTGAAGVLGGIIGQTLSEMGAGLVLVDRPGSNLEAVADARRKDGAPAVSLYECDLESSESRRELLASLAVSKAGIDILVNNAAFVGDSKLEGWVAPFEKQTVETWRRAVEVNLTAPFELCQGLAEQLARSGNGSVINIASLYGHLGPDWRLYEGTPMGNPAAYAASKGGLIQLTRWLATTLAPKVRVNAISPGGFFRNQPQSFVEKYEARTPLGRMAGEEDMKGTLAFLACDMSAYVTGQNLMLDGGWSVW